MTIFLSPDGWVACIVVLLALLLDKWGEPPARLHPVVWMGTALAWLGRRIAPQPEQTPGASALWQAGCGMLAWCLLAVLLALTAWKLQDWACQLPWPCAALALAVLLKPLFAWRMLCDETAAVETALQQSLPAGRARVAHLVSRDVAALDATQVRQAALSTLAENLNDSVIAPLFWFVLCGLPGAAVYRLANTADAMWGYRGVRNGRLWTWAGAWAARADDVLSWLPARLTAGLMALAAWRQHAPIAWHSLRAGARQTPSPNGGWPMMALALALGVHLCKPGVYSLNSAGRAPVAADMVAAQRLCARTIGAGAGVLIMCIALRLLIGTIS